MNQRSFVRSTTLLGMASALSLVSVGCGRYAPPNFERPPAPVTVAAAVARDVPHYLDSIGKVVAREVVSVQPQVSGRIIEIHFADGADVRKGDLLFTIDPRPYQAQLDAAEASLAQAKAAQGLARIEAARAETLVEAKILSRQEYDARGNAVEVASAQVQQAQAAVETARLNLAYCFIRSPLDGRTGHRLVDVGNVVSPPLGPSSGTALLVVQRLDPIYADFTITENDLTAVQRSSAHRALTAEVRLPDDDDPRVGALTFLDNAVQETTGTVKLRATIPNADRRFWAGRLVNVRLVLSTLKGAVLVPAAAPQVSAKGPFVYVVKDDSTAELRPVTPGQRHGALVVIGQGVAAGERVVVSGQLSVMPGGKVHVEEPRAAGTAPTAKLGSAS